MSSTKGIKFKTKSVTEMLLVLKELEKNLEDCELEITVGTDPDKDTISYLCHSKYIEDWDFIDVAEKGEPEIEIEENQPEPEKTDGVLGNIGIIPGDWNSVGWLIEAIWKTAQKSPAILFQTNFFYDAVRKEFESVKTSISPEHAILTMLTEIRYNEHGWNWGEIDSDFSERLKKLWPEMYGKSLAEISRLIYG